MSRKTDGREYSSGQRCGYHAMLIPEVLRELQRLPAGAAVLDAGCGNGVGAAALCRAGFRVTGIDVSESGIAFARQNCPQAAFEVVSITDPKALSLPGAPFDAIVSMEMIEHIASPAQCWANLRALLRNGGLLVMTTPYHGYLKNLLLALAGQWDRHLQPGHEGGHIKFWSKTTLVPALEANGFHVESVRGVGRAPFLWKSMLVQAVKAG